MTRIVPFFSPIITAGVLAATLLAFADVSYFWFTSTPAPTGAALFGNSVLLAVGLAVTVALVFSTLAVLLMPLLRYLAGRLGKGGDSPLDFVRELPRLLVAPTGEGWRALLSSVGLALAAVGIAMLDELVVPLSGVDNWKLVVAFAIWNAGAAVVPVLVLRLVSVRWSRWAPVEWWTWAVLAFTSYYVTKEYWVGAAPYRLWGAFPILLTPAAVTVHVALRERVRKAAAWIAAAVALVAIATVGTYPQRSAAHAYLTAGPVVAVGCWQVLAALSDLDGDGASHMVGGSDCDGLNYDVRPGNTEVVGNGIDDNCMGGDLAEWKERPLGSPAPQGQPRSTPPIILLTVDTLRADALGRTVDGRQVTPYLDALVDGSVYFENAYSTAAHTDEAVPALMNGMYPSDWHQHGVYFGVEPTLAEMLGHVGYQSRAVVLFPWLRVALIHGFQVIDNSLGEIQLRNERWLSGQETTKLALEHLDKRDPNRPIILWVHYFDAHMPRFDIPWLSGWLKDDLYAQSVHLVDAAVGDLMTGLEQRGLLDTAMIVFASDHGEALGEHNLVTHGWGVWESVIRVPLALRLPGVRPRTVQDKVSLVDVLPTVLDYLGLGDTVVRDGRSLLPSVVGQPLAPRPIYFESEVDERPTFFGVIDGDLKLSVDLRREAYRLYDLEADPGEQNNIIEERSEDADRLLQMLGARHDRELNDVQLQRKRDLWEKRGNWTPEQLITKHMLLDEVLK